MGSLCGRKRSQRSAAMPLCTALFLFLFSFSARGQTAENAADEIKPLQRVQRVQREPQAPTKAAVPPTAESAPETTASDMTAPPIPEPVPSQRTWPAVLVWTATGVAFVGTSIMAGGYLVTKDEVARQQGTAATIYTKGCTGTAACHTFFDADASAQTAGAVGALGLAICTLIASGLLSAGIIGTVTDPARRAPANHHAPAKDNPVRIEVAPTLGGMVLRGTF